MARARNIKPGFYKNPELVECSVWARLIFPGLWMLADREGRLEDRPKQIKMELLPADPQDMEPLLQELEAHGFLERYQIDGSRLIQITNFLAHQSPHFSEKPSRLKPPNSGNVVLFKPVDSEKEATLKDAVNERTPKAQPPDSLNPSSLTVSSPKKAQALPCPEGVNPQVWDDWLALRKAKKAPVTLTVVLAARLEAAKAGMTLEEFLREWCQRGSQGLKASWLTNNEPNRRPALDPLAGVQ